MKLLAIDIGASGGRAVLGEFRDEKLLVSELRRFPNGTVDIQGRKYWDILRLFEEVKECLKDAGDVGSLGIDTWGVDYGYIGRSGELLGIPFAYRDSRTEKSVPRVHEKISREELYKLTGIQFLPFNTIYQVADDLVKRPWLVEKADRLLMIPDLMGFLLTGERLSEYTIASTTELLDVRTREWSAEILEKIGFPGDKLGKPVHPGVEMVSLTDRIVAETGCRAKLICVAGHDTASAVAAIPMEEAAAGNAAYISSGTWSLVGTELRDPIVSSAAREANFTNEGGVGGTIRFLSNVTGLWLIEELRRMWATEGKEVDFETILREAGKAPRFKSIVNPDHQSFIAPDDMRVAIREFCRATGQTVPKGIGPLSRCVFESFACAYRRKIRQLEEITGRAIERIHVVGGGSRNRLLCQMTADACGVKLIAGPAEATALGNLLVQALRNGLINSIDRGRDVVRTSFPLGEYTPRESDLWQPVAERFEELVMSGIGSG